MLLLLLLRLVVVMVVGGVVVRCCCVLPECKVSSPLLTPKELTGHPQHYCHASTERAIIGSNSAASQ